MDAFPGIFQNPERHGEGAYGVVFVASDPRTGMRVALKQLRQERLATPSAVERFRREVETLARLSHPGIVPVLEAHLDADPPWYAMPFIDGWSLRRVFARKDRPAELVSLLAAKMAALKAHLPPGIRPFEALILDLSAKIADALGAAHARGVVHRDIKPDNIVLDRAGRVHLLDFGLAHFPAAMTLTGALDRLGTPLYMAPEQFTAGRVSARADVYALGHLIAHGLVGRPLRRGESEIEVREESQERPRPEALSHPEISPPTRAILKACLERAPRDRYRDATALAADLKRALGGIAVAPPALSLWTQLQSPRSVALLGGLLGGAVLWLSFAAGGAKELSEDDLLGPLPPLESLAQRVAEEPGDERLLGRLRLAVDHALQEARAQRLAFDHARSAETMAQLLTIEARAEWRRQFEHDTQPTLRALDRLVQRVRREGDPGRRAVLLRQLCDAAYEAASVRPTRDRFLREQLETEHAERPLVALLETAEQIAVDAGVARARGLLWDPEAKASSVLIAALRVLGRSYSGEAAVVPAVVRLLDSADSAVVVSAIATLGHIGGEEARRALLQTLIRRDGHSLDLLLALDQSGVPSLAELERHSELERALLSRLRREDSREALAAAKLLVRWPLRLAAVGEAVLDERLSLPVRVRLVDVLAKDPGAAELAQLRQILSREGPEELRLAAAEQLARRPEARIRRRLLAGLTEESTPFRLRVLLAAAPFGDAEVISALRDLGESEDRALRVAAWYGLAMAGVADAETTASSLRKLKEGRTPAERLAAANVLVSGRPTVESVQALSLAFDAEVARFDERVRRGQAPEALAGLFASVFAGRLPDSFGQLLATEAEDPPMALVQSLEALAKSEDQAVRAAAIEALLKALRSAAKPRVRAAAIAALGRTGQGVAGVMPALQAYSESALAPAERDLSLEAALALDRLGDATAVPEALAETPTTGLSHFIQGVLQLRRGEAKKAEALFAMGKSKSDFPAHRFAAEPECNEALARDLVLDLLRRFGGLNPTLERN